MEDGVSINSSILEDNKFVKMGTSGNPNSARIAVLQERKKNLEEQLAKRNQELRQLCIQEAELTGIIPIEMPLEPGESPPPIRRRIGTAFELSEDLIQNIENKDETITDLELQIQLHVNMAEAALGLANENNATKTIRRQHMVEYQKHKRESKALQEKLTALKEKQKQEQQLQMRQLQNESSGTEQQNKQKKKSRIHEQVADDTISIATTVIDPFVKNETRHSMRSMRHTLAGDVVDSRYPTQTKLTVRKPENTFIEGYNPEDYLASGVYRLSINGYKSYMEKHETVTNTYQHQQYNLSCQPIPYQYPVQYSMHLTQQNQHIPSSHVQNSHQPLLQSHVQQHSPQSAYLSHPILVPHGARTQHSPHMQQNSPQHSSYFPQHSPLTHQRSIHSNFVNCPSQTDYNKHMLHTQNSQNCRQSSPLVNSPQKAYYTSQTLQPQSNYRQSQNMEQFRTLNPLQLQPHQQYEHNAMTSGLGGYWKKIENGEMIWCNNVDWQRDKRFGSLDRRKNKRLHKRVSPSIDHRSATLSNVPSYQDHVRTASIKSSQAVSRKSQDRQLVRTQSLGSVGAQTVDSVWPSDDNSSCESDNRGISDQTLRKQKQKQWLETSLDGPVSPTHSVISRSHSAISSVLAPEEKYVVPSPTHSSIQSPTPPLPPPPLPPPINTKPPLEIPAESNPSPRMPETNLEMFNNNIPKNCTVVLAGQCKPYYEETKPFEMSDFYKYSTKFKKSPMKSESDNAKAYNQIAPQSPNVQKNLMESFDECSQLMTQKPSPMNTHCIGRLDNSNSLNSTLDISQLTPNVAEHFSAEMNAWYQKHDHQPHHIDNNNPASPTHTKRSATLV